MRRLALALLTTTLCAAPAHADQAPALCKALRGLAEEARRTGQPQRISAGLGADPATTAACRPVAENAATRSFCDAATAASGLAWRVYDCVNTIAAEPHVTTSDEHAERRSRNRITHLAAGLAHGARLDLSLAPSPARYEVVVWAPK